MTDRDSRVGGVVWCVPCAGCCGTLLDPYRDRIESLERGFLVESSALLLLFSLNRSRSDWTGAAPAVPEVAPTPGPAGVFPAALVELTCTDQMTWSAQWYLGLNSTGCINFKKRFVCKPSCNTITITVINTNLLPCCHTSENNKEVGNVQQLLEQKQNKKKPSDSKHPTLARNQSVILHVGIFVCL